MDLGRPSDVSSPTDFSFSPDGSKYIYRECIHSSNLKLKCTVKINLIEKTESIILAVSEDDESYSDFEMVSWSPDSSWFILNLESGSSIPYHTTVLLCDPLLACNEIRSEGLTIYGADWWQPLSDWKP
jgi:hypothetical protein